MTDEPKTIGQSLKHYLFMALDEFVRDAFGGEGSVNVDNDREDDGTAVYCLTMFTPDGVEASIVIRDPEDVDEPDAKRRRFEVVKGEGE